jgi:hypothetical protein
MLRRCYTTLKKLRIALTTLLILVSLIAVLEDVFAVSCQGPCHTTTITTQRITTTLPIKGGLTWRGIIITDSVIPVCNSLVCPQLVGFIYVLIATDGGIYILEASGAAVFAGSYVNKVVTVRGSQTVSATQVAGTCNPVVCSAITGTITYTSIITS